VEGNSLLDTRDIERAVYPHLGKRKTLADVEAARVALEKAYQAKGYGTVLVDIPEQSVDRGFVQLRVTEARLDRIRVTGSRYRSNRDIANSLTEARPGEVPNVNALIQQIGHLAQRSRDVQVTPIMRAGRVPGTVDLELRVKDQLPLHADVDLTNAHTVDTSDLRLNAGLTYSNLWQKDHSLSLQYQTSPQATSEVQVFAGTYLWRRENSDSLFAFYVVDSNSDVATLGTTTVLGKGTTGGARVIYPNLLTLGDWHTTVTAGSDYKDTTDTIALGDNVDVETKAKYMNFITALNTGRVGDRSQISFDLGLNFGLRGLLNERTEFEAKRFKGEPNYLYMTAAAQYRRLFGEGWSWIARSRAQLTGSRLIPTEQFSHGGESTVRGYLEAERLADYGAVGSLELHRGLRQSLFRSFTVDDAFAFVDGGYGWILDALPDQQAQFGMASVGVGVRLLFLDHGTLTLEGALPLQGAPETKAGDPRLLFEAQYNL